MQNKPLNHQAEEAFIRFVLKKVGHLSHLQVLVVGTGSGHVPLLLARSRPTWNISVLDASSWNIQNAEEAARAQGIEISWMLGRAEDTDIQPRRYDLILSHHVFHTWSNRKAVAFEMERLLKFGGVMLMQDSLRLPSWQRVFLSAFRFLARYFLRANPESAVSRDRLCTAREAFSIFRLTDLVHVVKPGGRWPDKYWRLDAHKPSHPRPRLHTRTPLEEVPHASGKNHRK